MLVTAFEEDKTTLNKSEIEIDGELYEIWENAPVLVFGHKVGTGAAGIKDVVAPYINAKNETTRNIVAEFTLNGKDEIESINFKMSINGFTKTDATTSKSFIINEFVVEKISAKNVITKVGNSFKNDLDDYEDLEPRVIKNGKVAEVAEVSKTAEQLVGSTSVVLGALSTARCSSNENAFYTPNYGNKWLVIYSIQCYNYVDVGTSEGGVDMEYVHTRTDIQAQILGPDVKIIPHYNNRIGSSSGRINRYFCAKMTIFDKIGYGEPICIQLS